MKTKEDTYITLSQKQYNQLKIYANTKNTTVEDILNNIIKDFLSQSTVKTSLIDFKEK